MTRRIPALLAALSVVATFSGVARADYGLDFHCRSDTVSQVYPGLTADFSFTLTNTGGQSDVYEFDCRRIVTMPDWAVVYCLGGRCGEPGLVLTDSLPAGATDTTVVIHVYTSSTAGEEIDQLRVRSLGNPALAESIRVHVLAGVGIEERGGATALLLLPAPNPVRRGTTLRLGEPGRIRLWGTDGRLVAAGQANASGWSIPAGVRPGVYLIEVGGGRARVVVQ